MNEDPIKYSSTLIADLKEQIQYLRELGVENLSVELPELSFQNRPPEENPKAGKPDFPSQSSRERLEKFVPSEDVIKNLVRNQEKPSDRKPPESRRGILEQTRLSNQPEMPKRNTYNFTGKKPETAGEKEMARKQVEEIPSLFEEMPAKLPESAETIGEIRADIGDCTRCPLHAGRTKIVHSTGNFQADLMFVGEAPGADEDAQGEPFVGRAGQLLTKIIESIGMNREEVFIGNINRCRPPGNRQPTADEAATCRPFLLREIAVVRPKVIVVLGNTATQNLLETKTGITKLRGNFQDYYGVKVMPTFHPAYLLRDPRKKREVWEDMKKVRDEINKLK